LFFFLRRQKLARIAHRDGAREAVRVDTSTKGCWGPW
jgi:hypothetical protein